VTELAVIATSDSMTWLVPLLIIGGIGGATALAYGGSRQLRTAALIAAMGVLLVAPGAWAVQTVGHNVSGTFPAGGPASAAMGGMPGGGGTPGGVQGGFGPGGGGPPAGGLGGGPMGGGAGNSQSLAAAVQYAKQHGGGTVAASGQMGAGQLVTKGADVAAIGGFSGRESQVNAAWLASAVERGQIRYVLTSNDGPSGMANDNRTGSKDIMAIVKKAGIKVSSVDGLYDLQGKAEAIRSGS
jgi:hypothetical protein